jgi:hypothetical protein
VERYPLIGRLFIAMPMERIFAWTTMLLIYFERLMNFVASVRMIGQIYSQDVFLSGLIVLRR